ncbi:MAG: hypothetical protein M3235_00030 [Actinomycetota bacterium]|nr:hypothetical protein [Actinomycetota bacterium]
MLGIFTGGVVGALLLRLGPGPALIVIAGLEAGVTVLYAGAPAYGHRPRSAEHS